MSSYEGSEKPARLEAETCLEVKAPARGDVPPTGLADQPGLYMTNEVFLYRVVGLDRSGSDDVIELEDCYGLDVVRVLASDLRERGLRAIVPAASDL